MISLTFCSLGYGPISVVRSNRMFANRIVVSAGQAKTVAPYIPFLAFPLPRQLSLNVSTGERIGIVPYLSVDKMFGNVLQRLSESFSTYIGSIPNFNAVKETFYLLLMAPDFCNK